MSHVSMRAFGRTLYNTSLADAVSRIADDCRNCKPLSMLECVASCYVWRLKNEFRELHKEMQDPDFSIKLLNALKNRRRLQLLKTLSNGHYSVSKLQEEMKKLGYSHSRKTIVEEYLAPLTDVKLIAETQGKYHTTLYGSRISDLTEGFPSFEEFLPPHSECHEETVLIALLSGPMTHEQMREEIPDRNVSRVLNRLQATGLVESSKERDRVMFYRTRRSSDKEKFSPTEKRIYGDIVEEGISARNLAGKSRISLRRTYKYLRRLKGKKMVFTREKPKTFILTSRGSQVALMLRKINELMSEIFMGATILVNDDEGAITAQASMCKIESENKAKAVIPLATSSRAARNSLASQ